MKSTVRRSWKNQNYKQELIKQKQTHTDEMKQFRKYKKVQTHQIMKLEDLRTPESRLLTKTMMESHYRTVVEESSPDIITNLNLHVPKVGEIFTSSKIEIIFDGMFKIMF